MTELLRLPSLRAAAALVQGWMVIVKLEKLKGLQVLEPLLPHMLGAYCDKSVKLRYDEEAGSFPDSPVADEEFIDLEVRILDACVRVWVFGERARGYRSACSHSGLAPSPTPPPLSLSFPSSPQEYSTLFSTLKANSMTIIKSAAENYPQQAVAFLKERLPALVARFGACKGVTVQDEAYRCVRVCGGGDGRTPSPRALLSSPLLSSPDAKYQPPPSLPFPSPFLCRQCEGLVNPLDRILASLPEPRQDKEEDVALVQSISWLLSVLLEWQVRAVAGVESSTDRRSDLLCVAGSLCLNPPPPFSPFPLSAPLCPVGVGPIAPVLPLPPAGGLQALLPLLGPAALGRAGTYVRTDGRTDGRAHARFHSQPYP
jgi:hypothetical protein